MLSARTLKKRGHKVWIDWKEIGNWDDWKGSITRGIDTSELTIAFITHHAMRNPGVCRNEIAIAMNRFGVVYLVLLEAGAEDAIPVIAKDCQWADLSSWRDIRDGKVPGVEWERWYEEKLVNLIERLEGEATTFADETRTLRRALRPSSFESKIAQHVPGFIGRDWVFDAYRQWLDDAGSRIFWIKAGPGVGKSAIAANLASRERSAIVASWFIDAKSNELRNPGHALRSLAFQLAQRWEDYRVRLMRQLQLGANATEENCDEVWRDLGTRNTQDLFRFLLAEPLNGLIWREHKLVIVIDALDEGSDGDGHNRIAELIGLELNSLPDWIGFVVTSRPEADVVNRLQGFKPFVLDATDPRNRADLVEWCRAHLSTNPTLAALPPAQQAETENLLVERSEGMILYLKVVEEGLREGSLTVAQLGQLEAGLPGLYRRYYDSFMLRFGQDYETAAKPLLRLLLAAAGALPEDLASAVLQWNKEQFLACRNRLGSFVTDTPDGQELFHKTLREWLDSPASGPFFLDAGIGRQAIADVLFAEVGRSEAYALRWRDMIRSWLPQWLPHLDQRSDAAELNKLASALNDLGNFTESRAALPRGARDRRAALPAGHPDIATASTTWPACCNRPAARRGRAALPRGARHFPGRAARRASGHRHSLNNLAGLLQSAGRYRRGRAALPRGARHSPGRAARRASGHRHEPQQPGPPAAIDRPHRRGRAALPRGARHLPGRAARRASGHRQQPQQPGRPAGIDRPHRRGRAALPRGAGDPPGRAARRASGHRHQPQQPGRPAAIRPAASPRPSRSSARRSTFSGPRCPPGIRTSPSASTTWPYLLHSTGRSSEAEPLYREALEMRRAALPAGHPDIATSLNNLAGLLQWTDRAAEAVSLYREIIMILETADTEGATSSKTLEARRCLAVSLRDSNEFDASFQEFRRLLDAEYQNIGREDELTLFTEFGFAKLLRMKGDLDEAQTVLDDALPRARKALGDSHSITKDFVELQNTLSESRTS